MVEGMMNLNYHAAFSLNGEIEESEGNCSDAMKDYQIAYDLGYAYVPEILADRYAEGRIVKKTLPRLSPIMRKAIPGLLKLTTRM